MHKTEFTYASSDGHSTVAATLYKPAKPPIGVVQISHGMCEYIERYQHFAQFLCDNGFVVCGNDHLGHKGTAVLSNGVKGYFAPKNGHQYLVEDLHGMAKCVKAMPEYAGLPYFVYGHSMGSFIAKLFVAKYPQLVTGAIFAGTSGTRDRALYGTWLSAVIKATKGDKYMSKLLYKLITMENLKMIKNPKTPVDWLTRDPAVIEAYLKDPWCRFMFTTGGHYDLFLLIRKSNANAWYKAMPKGLPVLLLAGDNDPVATYGKGIREIQGRLQQLGAKRVEAKLYPGALHELVNETNKEEVFGDILSWLEKYAA